MVSPDEASFDLRETAPLSRNMLHSWGVMSLTDTGQRASLKVLELPISYRSWLLSFTSPKVLTGNLTYPVNARDTAESGIGHVGNRYLRYLVEFISVNVGGSHQDAKASSLPIPDASVGGVIILGGVTTTQGARENRVQGKGRQLEGIPTQSNQLLTGRNLH
jgi:hypothetical protein